MKKLITEFIGTFFLILTIGMAVLGGAGNLAPVAIGLALMVMVYAGGHISGAHFNPAVTLGILIRGKITVADAVPYMIVQFVAAAIAAFVVQYLVGADKILANAAAANPNAVKALVAELLGTFALIFVVLNVATAKATAGNNYFGMAIGLTVTAMAYALGGISGGAFNPSVALAISIMKMAQWADIWFYLIGAFGGAVLAAFLFKYCNPEDN